MVENLPANAGDTGSSPDLGRSRMPRSDWAREPQTTEPASLEPVLRNERGPRIAMKSGPRLPQLEKALAQKRRPNTAKNTINKKKLKRKTELVKDHKHKDDHLKKKYTCVF